MDKIEVTQADRESAASLWINVDGDAPTPAILQEAERYRQGVYDHTPAVQAFARHRLATRTDATSVAWMYYAEDGQEATQPLKNRLVPNTMGWTEIPLYTHPPATDVAALVEALEWFLTGDRDVSGQALIYDGHWEQIATRIDSARQALAPFTKGQNDDAVR